MRTEWQARMCPHVKAVIVTDYFEIKATAKTRRFPQHVCVGFPR